MYKKLKFLTLLLCLLAGFNAKAQNVRIVEANVTQQTVYDALLYLQNNNVTPDNNGTIHIEILGNVTETKLTSRTYSGQDQIAESVNLTSRTDIKKIVVYPSNMSSDVTITMAAQSTMSEGTPQPVYRIHFANEAYLEVHHLRFTNRLAWVASTANSGKTSTTDFHDCVFNDHFWLLHTDYDFQSSHYSFNGNIWTEFTDYCFQNNNKFDRDITVDFNNNTVNRFRVVTVFPNQQYKTNVTMTGNSFYHLIDYSQVPGISSSVALCQITGPINGNYVFTGNKILGIFTKGGSVKAPSIMLQHGNNGYQGVMDGSSITIKNNTMQCDIAQFGWKAGMGASYETGDFTAMLKNHQYYNLLLPSGSVPQTGNYYVDIDDPIKVHMYTEGHDPHDDDDMCHVCKACGQMFVHGHAEGTGGLFQYLGEDGNLHNVADAQGTISLNLPIEKISPDEPELYQLVEENVVRDGFCLNVNETQDFIISPYLPGNFQSLKVYGGPTSPLDVTSLATTTDGGQTYHYNFKNTFAQASPYTGCPEIVAKFGGNPVWAFHSGSSTPYAQYATLADALSNPYLQNNDLIEFHGNTTETQPATISKNNITIKSMEGACCTADYSSFSVSSNMYGVITVNGTGLNISNIVFQNFSNPESSLSQKATLFYVDNGAEVTFGVNCTVTNIQCPHTSSGAAVYIKKGTVNVDGATFSYNMGMHGAAFYVEADGTLVVNDTPDDGAVTRLFGNEVKDTGGCGGAIANRDGTTTITGGEFYENYGKFGGSINNTGSLTISGGRFYNHVNCPAVANSGCQYCHVNGNPVFENNYGVSVGAAIQFQNWGSSTVGDCVIDGGTFRNNIVTWKGGAICLHNNPDGNHPVEVTINGGIFENNKSLQDGGAIDILPTCKLTITGGTFTGNVADIDKEDEVIGRGNAIWHNGNLMVSGNPVFGEDQDVYLVAMENVITKSGDINASVLVPVSMPLNNEVMGRDILVSSTGHNVVKADLQRFNVILENTTAVPRLSAAFTSSDAVTHTPVIELFACLWSEYVITCPATGYSVTDGNATISSKEGLAWLISVVNGLNGQTANNFNGKTVTLTNNVDMTEHIWEAIGTATHPFLGTFTSNGSTIKGLNNNADYGVAGLFGVVNGTVSNAFVEGCNFVANPDAETYFGIIANTVNGGTVHSSEAMGTLEAANANAHIGGVVGLASGSSEVHSVISYATLNGDDKGGIVNKLDGAGLKNSYAKFSQFTSGKELVATNNSGTVDNCYYVNGTTQKMSDATDFTIPGTWPYGYGVSGCMIDANRMIDVMNVWVNTNGATKYAAWAQPTTNGINADCPVLKLKDFNTMVSNDAPYIYYGDLDNKLDYANILFYGQKVGSSAYSGTNLYIDQDAALKTSGTLKANVGVPSGKTYGWHMFSTSLSDAPLGIDYAGYVPVGNDYGTPQTQVSFTADNGYFPTNSPYANWDFYCFDESNSTWVNYKRYTGDHFDTYTHGHIPFENETTLVSGRGYLMALKDMTYVQAYGTLNNANVNATVTYSGHHVKGCNFIGNPYHAYLDFDAFCTANSGKLASNSYAMIVSNGTTSDYITYAASSSKNPDQASRYIHPHQGFIVKVNAAGTLSFTPDQAVVDQTSPYREEHLDYPLVNLFATDSEGNREIATAELGRPDNGGALKIDDMLTGKGSLAISNEGQRYAIAFIEGQPNEVAVHFIANEDGDFTMSWNTHNGTFSYLHLVDNMTGMDVDCLASDEYKFTAHAGDYASRFKLKFEFTGVDEDNAAESSEEFAFFHQGSLVVNGQGSLELIDLSGRVIMSTRLSNVQSTVSLPEVSEGLYLLRLADDSNVKTQKIIIKK